MYPQARPGTNPEHPQAMPSPMMSASAGGKRKRGKSVLGDSMGKAGEKGSDEETGASGSDIPRVPSAQQSQAPQTIVDLKKRTKTVSHLNVELLISMTQLNAPIPLSSNVPATRVDPGKYVVTFFPRW